MAAKGAKGIIGGDEGLGGGGGADAIRPYGVGAALPAWFTAACGTVSLLHKVNGRTLLEAWEQALNLIQLDIRAEHFQTYLAPTHPQNSISPGILTIAAPTPYLRDWLTSRLTATLSRLLCGILDQPITILFECPP